MITPKPLEHSCPAFDVLIQQNQIMKSDQGFYIKFIEWSELPPDQAAQLRVQMLEQLKQQTGKPLTELPSNAKPFIVLGQCPACATPLISQ